MKNWITMYPDGLNVIAIGGNKLSRGLTLEGLCVSFFIRRTKNVRFTYANGPMVWV